VFGHLSTGAADDPAKVTDIARDRVTRYGMVEDLGCVAYEVQQPRFLDLPGLAPGGCPIGPQTQQRIDDAVRGIVMLAFGQATAILDKHRDTVDADAQELLRRETLDHAALLALASTLRADEVPPAIERRAGRHEA
jgi:cell division protease FtsH